MTRSAPRTKRRTPAATTAPRRARTPAGLSHGAICSAALRLIDAHGIAAFSTRKLGLALGCEAMAIYWYYPSKQALLDAVVDRLMAPVARIARRDELAWVTRLRQLAHGYRRIARDHPNAFPLLASRRFASEGTYAFLEQLFELARRHGISDRTAGRFYRVVSSYCSGFAMNELAARPDPEAPGTVALRERFPRVAAVSAWLEPEHLDETFGFGLELLLEALAREATAEPARRRAR